MNIVFLLIWWAFGWPAANHLSIAADSLDAKPHRYLYVAVPGIRNYLEYGGHGILVYDIDKGHKFVKRISTQGMGLDGKPANVKGIAVSLATQCVYVTTIHSLQCIQLQTEKVLWEKPFAKGCDRLSISPDGKEIYVPSFEQEDWYVLDAVTGDLKHTVSPNSGAHNTIYGLNGKEVYLEGLRSPYLTVVNASDPTQSRKVGPFANSIRPFTVNGKQTRVYVNINDFLGFEVGDLVHGNKMYAIKVNGFEKGPVKRHGCPSHGIGLTPDETELWLSDAFNQQMHIFKLNGDTPPVQTQSIALRDQPGWITFTRTGDYAYPATGEVIDVKTKKIILTLHDEHGIPVQSEKMVEIDFTGKMATSCGDQFGIGRLTQ
ncbi:MAG: hypothetical protein WBB35_16280 [Saprospiraceae bacterium]